MAHMPGPGEPTFGHTDSVFPDPEAVSGAPHEPAPMRAISRIEMLLASVAFCGILVGVLYQVLGRYVPSVSWIGAGELALLSMVSLNFLMIGYLTGRNGHITIEIFDTMLAGKKSFVALRVFSALIMLAYLYLDGGRCVGKDRCRDESGYPYGFSASLTTSGSLISSIMSPVVTTVIAGAGSFGYQLRSGDIDVDLLGSSELSTTFEPITAVDAAYAFDDADHLSDWIDNAAADLFDEFQQATGVKIVDGWLLGNRTFTTKGVEVRNPDALAGAPSETEHDAANYDQKLLL